MSEARLSTLEKEVALVKQAQQPLIDGLKENTDAQRKLIGKMEIIITKFDNLEDGHKDHEGRIRHLEKTSYTRQSAFDGIGWATKTAIAAIVAALLAAAGAYLSKG